MKQTISALILFAILAHAASADPPNTWADYDTLNDAIDAGATLKEARRLDATGKVVLSEVRSATFAGSAVTFSAVTIASNASLASPAVLCSNAHVVAFWPQCFANAATSITFTVELSPDGSSWARNDDLVYVADNGASETNRFISVAADGAAAARLVISSPVIVTLTTNRMVSTIKQ